MNEVHYDWFVDFDTKQEITKWIEENIHHGIFPHEIYCDVYCFNDEIEAMAFKLRWA